MGRLLIHNQATNPGLKPGTRGGVPGEAGGASGRRLLWLFTLMLGGMLSTQAQAATRRIQVVEMQSGWNAVFLEVQPRVDRPAELFRGLPIATVACPLPGSRGDQFLRSPGDAPWKTEGWVVWHAPARPEAFLSNLHRVTGRRAYLIQADAAFTWRVEGEARAADIEWKPNSCTLTGLPVEAAGTMTFGGFFSGSPAHEALRVLRMEGGSWRAMSDPRAQRIRAGEAYWIETRGASAHQGPLAVRLPARGEIDFGVRGAVAELEFSNLGDAPARVRVEAMSGNEAAGVGAGTGEVLRLRKVSRDLVTFEMDRSPLTGALELSVLAPGSQCTVRLEPDRDAMRTAEASVLLRLTDGRGWERWVPVRAQRDQVASLVRP